ncbi:MAG: hypothetical protein PVH29_05050 [Candidatus Zixiibacteriota bacterium]|jgi:hypothetical protein
MGENKSKVPAWTALYLNLYDVLGYVAPGFVLLAGLFAFAGRYGFCGYDLRFMALKHFVSAFSLYVVAGGIVACYLAGNFLAALSKIPERFNLFGLARVPDFLFEGGAAGPRYKRGVPEELLERFARAYWRTFLRQSDADATGPYLPLLRGMAKEGRLRYGGVIWDCYDYLLSREPAQHYAAYSFLSLYGFFRAVMAAGVLLTIFAFTVVDYGAFSAVDVAWLAVPIIITLFSVSRYLKFGRQFYYQTLRSFAVVVRE